MSAVSPQDLQCLTVLQAAVADPVGIVLRTNNAAHARQTLYNFRSKFGDPTLAEIHIRVSPRDSEHELWLIRRTSINPTVGLTDFI